MAVMVVSASTVTVTASPTGWQKSGKCSQYQGNSLGCVVPQTNTNADACITNDDGTDKCGGNCGTGTEGGITIDCGKQFNDSGSE